jgi:phospholipid/cholesterol/gamma-HCH transport system substrate-binding protein
MSVDLYPGAPPKPQLGDDATIDLAHTAPPVELSTLLGARDVDTRAALTSFVTASGEGTAGQGSALRRALVAMGPTTRQVRRLVDAIQGRRQELSRFVTNLARVTRAASRDRRLATVVAAGHTTLAAVARQDAALGTALSRLPSSLRTTQQTLELTASFSRELRPAVEALQPAVGRLPKTFAQIRTLATAMRSTVDAEVRPLVRAARPLAEDLSPTIPALARLSPHVTHALQTATYVLNELAYNPPGDDEGGLFWMSWFFHNWRSFVSVGDAHGTIIRGIPFISCQSVEGPAQEVTALVHTLFNLPTLCPR